jgi:hypothetical protein
MHRTWPSALRTARGSAAAAERDHGPRPSPRRPVAAGVEDRSASRAAEPGRRGQPDRWPPGPARPSAPLVDEHERGDRPAREPGDHPPVEVRVGGRLVGRGLAGHELVNRLVVFGGEGEKEDGRWIGDEPFARPSRCHTRHVVAASTIDDGADPGPSSTAPWLRSPLGDGPDASRRRPGGGHRPAAPERGSRPPHRPAPNRHRLGRSGPTPLPGRGVRPYPGSMARSKLTVQRAAARVPGHSGVVIGPVVVGIRFRRLDGRTGVPAPAIGGCRARRGGVIRPVHALGCGGPEAPAA